MTVPDISSLYINESSSRPSFSDDITDSRVLSDYDLHKLRCYAQSLPYAIESTSNMMELLDFIILRIVQCVEARDYDVGLLQWDSMLSY